MVGKRMDVVRTVQGLNSLGVHCLGAADKGWGGNHGGERLGAHKYAFNIWFLKCGGLDVEQQMLTLPWRDNFHEFVKFQLFNFSVHRDEFLAQYFMQV